MNIAICDDEEIIREMVRGLIGKQHADFSLDDYETGEELLAAKKRYDIIFLDIKMDGRNGIETAGALRERGEDVVLIFITGVREYVFDAFDVAAFHYLLKPIEVSKFLNVFACAVEEVEKRRENTHKQLFIKTKSRNITLYHKDILYVENRGRKVEIHTAGEVIDIYAAMAELEKQLGGSFYRCHRGYLVNMAHITEYNTEQIRLDDGETIYLARGRYQEFVKIYMRYLRNGGISCV